MFIFKKNNMLNTAWHIPSIKVNNKISLGNCHWYVDSPKNGEALGDLTEENDKRPEYAWVQLASMHK
jgi:hypothetical protein